MEDNWCKPLVDIRGIFAAIKAACCPDRSLGKKIRVAVGERESTFYSFLLSCFKAFKRVSSL